MKALKKGMIQVYTGNGKGKTTAALGLALRASGAGLKVYIHQFIKGKPCSETKVIKNIKNIKLEYCGRGCFVKGNPEAKDIKCAERGLEMVRRAVRSGEYDVVILDEANVALKVGLLKAKEVIDLIKNKPISVELVLTGRGCPPAIIKEADLVTEMREVKHPFSRGIVARCGIEC